MRFPVTITFVLLGVCAAGAAGAFALRGSVIANGGPSAPPSSNGVYRLFGTAGQPGIGLHQAGGTHGCAGFWCYGGPRVLDVDPSGGAPPLEFALGPSTPNPTRDRARFDLALPRSAMVTLTVYDVAGRQVGDPLARRLDAGRHSLSWGAPDIQAGVYFMRLTTDGVLRAKRTIILVH